MPSVLARRIGPILAALAIVLTGCDKHAADKEAICDVNERYDYAVATRDGAAAAKLVTKTSLDYYERVVSNALTMPEQKLKALGWGERCESLYIRHYASGDKASIRKLQELKGAALWGFIISQGWGFPDDSDTKPGAIRVRVNSAEMDTFSDRKKDPIPTYFAREGDQWLLDLSQDQRLNRYVANITRRAGVSENDFIMYILEEGTGRPPDEKAIWKPLSGQVDVRNPLLDN